MTREMNRRDLLRLSGFSAVGLGLGAGLTAPTNATEAATAIPNEALLTGSDGRLPRNIIFMVSDGMSMGVLSLAEPFSRMVRGQDRGTWWHKLLQSRDTVHGLAETYSADSMVTDSAAAASAWGGGRRVNNGAINVLPNGKTMTPIAKLMQEHGRRVGLVTTTRITHATPAAFAAVQAKRGDEELIAPQFMNRADVIMGGGIEFFASRSRSDKRDLITDYRKAGYRFAATRSDLFKAGSPKRLLGLVGPSHLPYTIDHRVSDKLTREIPTLAEMTKSALGILADSDRGFLLQVEGGRIDHACHRNDAPCALWDQLAFDDAVGVALEFSKDRDDTLIVVTTDHGNANPGLNGMGKGYRDSNACFERLAEFNASHDQMIGIAKGAGNSADIWHDVIKTHSGGRVDLDKSDAMAIANVAANKFDAELDDQQANIYGVLAQTIGNHTGIGWNGTTHTSDYVLVSAVGVGAQRFGGLQRNTDTFALLTAGLSAKGEA